jgi:UDP-GlcNAc:undecaprenyl-phosphate/decaprenyl-phosphate GlcNAc-1-phosphate transferase
VSVPLPYAYAIPLAAAALAYALMVWMLGPHGLRLPLDRPNERSLHETPVPRTGGLAIMVAVIVSGIALGAPWLILGCALWLALVSFVDDRNGLPARFRFAAQAVAAILWLLFATPDVPLWLLPLLFLAIVWVTNLYNFMDGMDGLAGGMAAFGFGAYSVAFWAGGLVQSALLAATVAAVAIAFLRFNFHPAQMFMGDVGSIPLGFLAAATGIGGWRDGVWPVWFPIAVFSPFIFDATVTLMRRAMRRERVWEAHRSHYYQRLVQLGWGHRNTALAEYALMAACAAVALAAHRAPLAVQIAVCASGALAYAALAVIVDGAWRRRHERVQS